MKEVSRCPKCNSANIYISAPKVFQCRKCGNKEVVRFLACRKCGERVENYDSDSQTNNES